MLGRGAHRELVHVRLAQDHGARGPQPLGDVGVIRREVALEDPRTGGHRPALDRDEVLERDRDAEERLAPAPEMAAHVCLAAQSRELPVRLLRRGERRLRVEMEPRVERAVLPLGAIQVCPRQVAR